MFPLPNGKAYQLRPGHQEYFLEARGSVPGDVSSLLPNETEIKLGFCSTWHAILSRNKILH